MTNTKFSKMFTLLAVLGFSQLAVADCLTDKLERWSTADHRAEGNSKRNNSRNPTETLKFFGIQPTMTVVEISPGGGWYTEILAPFLRKSGTLYLGGADGDSDIEYYQRSFKRLNDKLGANPEVYDKAIVSIFDPAGKMEAAPEGVADMVLTFRNTHNWAEDGNAQTAFAAMYTYLKPGGVLGLVQHRGDEGQKHKGDMGYLSESQVIGLAEAAGFVLLDKSEINANPKDTKNHPYGVWSLPPVLRLDEKDAGMKDGMMAMGESDRMTLKFMRPAPAPAN